jgi:hypothetical protein
LAPDELGSEHDDYIVVAQSPQEVFGFRQGSAELRHHHAVALKLSQEGFRCREVVEIKICISR